MKNTSRSTEDWQHWIQLMLDRLPAKSRYQRFYAELDRSIPDWYAMISSPPVHSLGGRPGYAGWCVHARQITLTMEGSRIQRTHLCGAAAPVHRGDTAPDRKDLRVARKIA